MLYYQPGVKARAPTLLRLLAQDLGNGTSQLVACGLKGQTVTQRPGFKQLTTRLPVDVAARRAGPRAPPARLAHTPKPSALHSGWRVLCWTT
jgi:hypothetical protein